MPGSGRNGLIATNAGCSPNLAERHAPSALGYGTARPGSANCVEPGLLFDKERLTHEPGRLPCRLLLATSPQSSHPLTLTPDVRTSCSGVAWRSLHE